MFSFFVSYLFILLCIDIILMLMSPYYWGFDLFIHFVPLFLVAGGIGMLLLLFRRKYFRALFIAISLVYFGFPVADIYRPISSPVPVSGEETITVFQANVHKRNESYVSLMDRIRTFKPTMIALNEVHAQWLDALRYEFPDEYPYSIELPSDEFRGMAFFSRTPIDSYEVLQLTEESPPLLRVRMRDDDLTVFVVHALPPMNEGWAKQRDSFIEQLAQAARETTGSVLIVGDLNVTLHSHAYRELVAGGDLTDSRRGFGLEPSWMRGTIIALPIDQVLYRGNLIVRDFSVLDDIGSDHRPVLVTFSKRG